jgi:hypothetical protein
MTPAALYVVRVHPAAAAAPTSAELNESKETPC